MTIPVPPTEGKNIGIELIGSAMNRDELGNITELENQENAATTGGQNTARGNLTIVEAGIYAPLK